MDKSWRDNFTAQYAANGAWYMTAALLIASVATAYWAWRELVGPVFAVLVIALIVLVLVAICCALYLTDRAKAPEDDAEHLAALTDQIEVLKEISSAKDGIIEQWKSGSDKLTKIYEETRDELADARTTVQTQLLQIKVRDERLDDQKPKVDWADKLIESARGVPPFFIQPGDCWLPPNVVETLAENEPWFDLVASLNYTGIHRLVVGAKVEGFLARWSGKRYNYDPIVRFGHDEDRSFVATGPTGVRMTVTQRVSKETAIELTKLILDGAHATSRKGAINIVTKGLHISVQVFSVFDEELCRGRLFGEEVEVRYTLGA